MLAESPNAPKQRVLTPDVAAIGNSVLVSYIKQRATLDEVCLAISKDSATSWTIECFQEPAQAISTHIAAYSLEGKGARICVGWLRLENAIPAVYHRCADILDDIMWFSNAVRLSTAGVPAGQHRLLHGDFQGDWTGNLDNAVSVDGVFYAAWSENYNTLKAARSVDGVTWEACGDIAGQSGFDVRFPTIYADEKGRVYLGAAQAIKASDIQVWVSYDQCATWHGPVNITNNSGFSDAAEFAVLKDTFYSVNDDSTTNPEGFDLILSACEIAPKGLTNCQETRVISKDTSWARLKTDGKGLHVVGSLQGEDLILYCYSADESSTWVRDFIPDSRPSYIVINDRDFGVIISKNNIAVGGGGQIYVVWSTFQSGKSKIMLSVRTELPIGQAAPMCAAP